MSEGDPEGWAAVARAISDRVRELGWRQRELAERSHVSVAVVREIQRHTVERRRSPRTLEALSVASGGSRNTFTGRSRAARSSPEVMPRLILLRCGLALIPSTCGLPRSPSF